MDKALDSIVLEPLGEADAAVVWLHGLGADGHDFEAIVPELRLPPDHAIRFVFPHAPVRPITLNGGMLMRGWYDIIDTALRDTEDQSGIQASSALIGRLLDDQLERGITAGRLVLAGFSQGGAIVLQTGLRYPRRLGGIMALSAYLPLAASLRSEATAANRDTPIFMAHGTEDPLVPEHLGERSASYLQELGYRVDFKTYPMPHAVCAQEIADIARWLTSILEIGRESAVP